MDKKRISKLLEDEIKATVEEIGKQSQTLILGVSRR